MTLPSSIQLQSRLDEYSYQVFTAADHRFWFRLVREDDRDVITDFFLGSFPAEQGGNLLVGCYRTLGLTPKPTIVFRDILSGRDGSDVAVLSQANARFEVAGQSLLAQYGFETIDRRMQDLRGKVDLILFGSKK
jgi:hypothetical protein